jgi:acetolactate decarboxylase
MATTLYQVVVNSWLVDDFHFISKDRTKGGHILDCSAQQLRARIQIVSDYDVRPPEAGPFLTADLSRDPASDLAKAE